MFNSIEILILIAVVSIISYFSYKVYTRVSIDRVIKNYNFYSAILQYNMDKAYETIYKDNILIYSVEATRIPDVDFNTYTRDFILLVQKLLGPRLMNEFIFLYGNYDIFTFNVADYFNRKYEEDEIRKDSMENLMESELEVTPQDIKWPLLMKY